MRRWVAWACAGVVALSVLARVMTQPEESPALRRKTATPLATPTPPALKDSVAEGGPGVPESHKVENQPLERLQRERLDPDRRRSREELLLATKRIAEQQEEIQKRTELQIRERQAQDERRKSSEGPSGEHSLRVNPSQLRLERESP